MGVGTIESIPEQYTAESDLSAVEQTSTHSEHFDGIQATDTYVQQNPEGPQSNNSVEQAETAQQTHSHELADGTIVTGSYAEAIEKCPAMAGMSLKQVALAARLQARGREKIQREAEQAATKQANKDQDKPRVSADKADKTKSIPTPSTLETQHGVAEQVTTHTVDGANPRHELGLTPDPISTDDYPMKRAFGERAMVEQIESSKKSDDPSTAEMGMNALSTIAATEELTQRPVKPAKPDVIARSKLGVILSAEAPAITQKPKTKMQLVRATPDAMRAAAAMGVPAITKIIEHPTTVKRENIVAAIASNDAENLDVEKPASAAVDILVESDLFAQKLENDELPADVLEANIYDTENVPMGEQPDSDNYGANVELVKLDGEDENNAAVETFVAHPALILVDHFKEEAEVPPQYSEPVEVFVATLPPTVLEKFTKFVATREPEEVAAVEEITINIAVMAERLHVLETSDPGDMTAEEIAAETEAIEEKIVEYYTELLTTIGVEVQPEMITAFLELVRSDEYTIESAQIALAHYDPVRELDHHGDLDNLAKIGGTVHKLSDYVGRHAVWNSSFGARDILFAA